MVHKKIDHRWFRRKLGISWYRYLCDWFILGNHRFLLFYNLYKISDKYDTTNTIHTPCRNPSAEEA